MFTVCIPTIRSHSLLAAIDSVRRQTRDDWELIIVGQSDDPMLAEIAEQAARSDSRIHYLHLLSRGASRARNTAIKAAAGEWIAFLDDDCEADRTWLATIAEYVRANDDVGLVGGALLRPAIVPGSLHACPALIPSESVYDPPVSNRLPPAGWDWVGANVAIARSVLQQLGPFDIYLGPGTAFPVAEDTDYKLRLEAAGIKMAATPRSIVYHTHGVRYGLRAVLQNSRNYGRGNGAMAAKLTLMGDPRGRAWVEQTRRLVSDTIRQLASWETARHLRAYNRIVAALNHLRHFMSGYHACLRNYKVDPATQLLCPLGAAPLLTRASGLFMPSGQEHAR